MNKTHFPLSSIKQLRLQLAELAEIIKLLPAYEEGSLLGREMDIALLEDTRAMLAYYEDRLPNRS